MSEILKILADGELVLADKDLLECVEVVLLVENQHRFLVVYRVQRTERNRAIAIGYQQRIARDAGGALVPIHKRLNITE